MRIRDLLGISERTQERLTRAMQLSLILLAAFGAYQQDVKLVMSALVPLGVSVLPAVLQRDPRVTMDAGIVLWVTTAAFLHALGSHGIYTSVPGYDHLTHAFSSTLLAGIGYAIVRAVDVHADGVEFPERFVFVFILIFTMAFGVMWEVLEFFFGVLGDVFGTKPFLTQFGLADTMKDMTFNMVGAVLVAIWGQAYMSGLVETAAGLLGYERLSGDDDMTLE